MRQLLAQLLGRSKSLDAVVETIRERCESLRDASDETLKATYARSKDLVESTAVVTLVIARVLGIFMFNVQLQGAVALANGKIAEMQTGEGKTLAAVPAVAWYAKRGCGVHVMTANDYLARRDAQWMGPLYEYLGLSVGYIQQGMSSEERRHAYACDVTYSTANEIGFDYLRDQLALYPKDQVLRPFSVALVDEADSILIDEARIPLVIAGGDAGEESLACKVDGVARSLRRDHDFALDVGSSRVDLQACKLEYSIVSPK